MGSLTVEPRYQWRGWGWGEVETWKKKKLGLSLTNTSSRVKAPKTDILVPFLLPPRLGPKATAGSPGFSAMPGRKSLLSSFYFQTPLSFPGDSCLHAQTSSPSTSDGSSPKATTKATPTHHRGLYPCSSSLTSREPERTVLSYSLHECENVAPGEKLSLAPQ